MCYNSSQVSDGGLGARADAPALPEKTQAEAESLIDDDTPFGALGGDSVAAVQVISLASQHGLLLQLLPSFESLSLNQLVEVAVWTCSDGI